MEKAKETSPEIKTNSRGAEWKTKQDEWGTQVRFADDYKFLGRRYMLEEIDTTTEIALVELFIDAGLSEITTISDILRVDAMARLVTKLVKSNAIFQMLALVLKRVEDDGRLTPCEPGEFRRGKAVLFHPFIREVTVDFFYLNSSLYEPIIDFAKGFMDQAESIKNIVADLTTSISSAAAE